jgi:hypothetical protein
MMFTGSHVLIRVLLRAKSTMVRCRCRGGANAVAYAVPKDGNSAAPPYPLCDTCRAHVHKGLYLPGYQMVRYLGAPKI